MGRGPGLSTRRIAQQLGGEKASISVAQLGPHTHGLESSSASASTCNPAGKMMAQSDTNFYSGSPDQTVPMNSASISSVGGGQIHENVMPSLCLNYIIALEGEFPARN